MPFTVGGKLLIRPPLLGSIMEDKIAALTRELKKKEDKETARRLLFMLNGARDDTIYALEARALAAWVLGG